MIDILVWIILAFLLIVSIMDFKIHAIPSILLTAMIFLVVGLNPMNLLFGILGFIMAFLLYEAGFFGGVADIKIMTLISFMISSLTNLSIFILLVMAFGIAWKCLWYWRFKILRKKIPDEFPFIPVFIFVYITLILVGGIL